MARVKWEELKVDLVGHSISTAHRPPPHGQVPQASPSPGDPGTKSSESPAAFASLKYIWGGVPAWQPESLKTRSSVGILALSWETWWF